MTATADYCCTLRMLLLLVLPVIRKVEHVIIPTVRGICFLVAVSSRRAPSLLILMEIL